MKSPIYFFPIGPTYPLSKIIKQLWLGSPRLSYVIIKERVVASFKHILDPVFGGDLASVLTNLTKSEK